MRAISGWLSPAACLALLLGGAAAQAPAKGAQPQPSPEKKQTSPEDQQRVVAIAHKLEAAPLDPALVQDREWALRWVLAAPDVHVKICTALLADLRRAKYKYRSELGTQQLLASAAFLIEHHEQADDSLAQSTAGVEGVLKAYAAILKANPDAHSKLLDELQEKQGQGKLGEWVRETGKDCK